MAAALEVQGVRRDVDVVAGNEVELGRLPPAPQFDVIGVISAPRNAIVRDVRNGTYEVVEFHTDIVEVLLGRVQARAQIADGRHQRCDVLASRLRRTDALRCVAPLLLQALGIQLQRSAAAFKGFETSYVELGAACLQPSGDAMQVLAQAARVDHRNAPTSRNPANAAAMQTTTVPTA